MSAELLTKLIEAGTPAALVAEVAMVLGRAQADRDALEQRRSHERDRKAKSREVTGQGVTDWDKGSLEVSPQTPLPKPSKVNSPPNTPQILTEKLDAIGTCLRRAYPAPDGVTEDQWAAFRKQRKKSLNERSYALLCKKLVELAEDGWPPGEMVDRAIEHGWETVFAPRNQGHGRTNALGRNQSSSDGLSSTARAALQVFGPG